MKRTQIQLPDTLYIQLKRLAAAKEWSLADILRAGAEYIVRIHPLRDDATRWLPPQPQSLGAFVDDIDCSDWRELANDVADAG